MYSPVLFYKEQRKMEGKQKHLAFLSLLIFLLPILHGSSIESPPQSVPSKHFVLVHGACHGAWSWFKIVAPLKSYGHNVTAIDLAASAINLKNTKSLRSISDYHRPLMEFMASLPPHEKVILVGHSLGGLAISQVMERFPNKVSAAVFVTALMPGPEFNVSTVNQKALRGGNLMDTRYGYDDGSNKPPTTLIWGPKYLSLIMYRLSSIEDYVLATTLMRPVRLFSEEDQSKNIMLTKEKYGSVDRVYIISEKDEVFRKEIQLWMTEKNPPSDVIEILGSDHMVMMSKPRELCTLLFKIAMKYG